MANTTTVRLPRSRAELTKLARSLGLVAWKREPLAKIKAKCLRALQS
jgi:hypothetical protein